MAILYIEGFEQFSGGSTTSERNTNEIQINRKYDADTVIDDNARIISGHNSTAALSAGEIGALAILDKVLDSVENTLYVSFSLRYDSLGSDPIQYLILRNGANTQCVFRVFTDGSMDVRRGTGTVVDSTGTGVFPFGQWVYVEILVEPLNSGQYDIRVDGSSVLSGTGDLQNISSAGADTVRFIFENQSTSLGSRGVMAIDNLVIQDSGGDFLLSAGAGSWYIEGVTPNAVGDTSDLTPSSGDNYTNVDEIPADDDTSTVSSSTTTDQDLYGYSDLTALDPGFDIKAAQLITTGKASSSESLISLTKTGTTTDKDAGQSVGTGYETVTRLLENDPDTSLPWTEGGVNGAQFGVEVG